MPGFKDLVQKKKGGGDVKYFVNNLILMKCFGYIGLN